MNIIVAGGRDFNDYPKLCYTLSKQFATVAEPVIVCGEARGADSLGRKYAEEFNIPILSYPAEWDKYGKSAGYKRNEQMAKVADTAIVFWDGMSRGSWHMINTMRRLHKPVYVVKY